MEAGPLDGDADTVGGEEQEMRVGLREFPERRCARVENTDQSVGALERHPDERADAFPKHRAVDVDVAQVIEDERLVAGRQLRRL